MKCSQIEPKDQTSVEMQTEINGMRAAVLAGVERKSMKRNSWQRAQSTREPVSNRPG